MQRCPEPFRDVSAVVAIPVRDEVERIGDCLTALGMQAGAALGVALLVNNTTDATLRAVADLTPTLACPIAVIEHHFPPERANAGQARRLAMEHADRLAPAGAPLLTTDADGRAQQDWLARNLFYLRHGADAVFGRAEIDPVEAARIPPGLHKADAEECAYAALLDEIAWLIDPDPADPWPRHTEHSGASIAVSRRAFHRVGGIPAVPLGEDRAFHDVLLRVDAQIRHAWDVRVVVSGRILGRAVGGMADTIRRRLVTPDTMLDSALEPVVDRVRRLRRRRTLRHATGAAALEQGADQSGFGESWDAENAAWPMARVRVADLMEQTRAAIQVRDGLLASEEELSSAD